MCHMRTHGNIRNHSPWKRGVESNFPRGHGRDSRPASTFSVADLTFPISLFIGRVSHADLTTVVLDAAARTAFPATRPEAQRRMQPRMAVRREAKISRGRCSFCSAEFRRKDETSEWWRASRHYDRSHASVVIQPAEASEKDYRPVTGILLSRRSLESPAESHPSIPTSTISVSSAESPEVPGRN